MLSPFDLALTAGISQKFALRHCQCCLSGCGSAIFILMQAYRLQEKGVTILDMYVLKLSSCQKRSAM
jgi:homoserine kinase